MKCISAISYPHRIWIIQLSIIACNLSLQTNGDLSPSYRSSMRPKVAQQFPNATPIPTEVFEILTWASCWVTAKGSSFEKLFLHYHYFPYRSPTENRKTSRHHYSKPVCNVIPFFSVKIPNHPPFSGWTYSPGNIILHHPRTFPTILISSLSWLLKVFPMSLLQRRKTFV